MHTHTHTHTHAHAHTHTQALPYLETAEKHNQEEYIGNWLLLGKTHLQLKNKVEAKKWLTKVMEHGGSNKEVSCCGRI